jgi:hypothetical protein
MSSRRARRRGEPAPAGASGQATEAGTSCSTPAGGPDRTGATDTPAGPTFDATEGDVRAARAVLRWLRAPGAVLWFRVGQDGARRLVGFEWTA